MMLRILARVLYYISLIAFFGITLPIGWIVWTVLSEPPYTNPAHILTLPDDYKELDSIITGRYIKLTTGATLYVNEAGDPKGKLLLFIHGFPENAIVSWKYQIPYFVKKGYFVVAPDMRGYGKSVDPSFNDPMNGNHIEASKDIDALIHHYQRKQSVVVAHDWGGGATFEWAARFPDSVEKVVILNMINMNIFKIHPWALFPWQIWKSWYIYMHQWTGFAENFYFHNDFAWFVNIMAKHRHTLEDINRLKADWKGSITSMLNWYRYSFRKANEMEIVTIKAPLLLIFGKEDFAIEWKNAELSVQKPFCENGKIQIYEGVNHWIQHEIPERVNADILKFIE